jgi:iron transport multicopper oxidase
MRSFFLALLAAPFVLCKTVEREWNITWVQAAPDGFSRPVIGVNGQWPCPELRATVGDRVIVTINNHLGNQSTGIHWHGIHQNGTGTMDGAAVIHQCPVPPGHSFTYEWTVSPTSNIIIIIVIMSLRLF